jgi:hypothetical protein
MRLGSRQDHGAARKAGFFAQVSPGATIYPGLRDLAAASGIAATALSLFRFDVIEKGL